MPGTGRVVPLCLLHFVVAAYQPNSVAFAQESEASATLLLALGEKRSANLLSLTRGEARFQFDEGEAAYIPGQWVRWGHPRRPAFRSHLRCRDGSVFVSKADWSSKVPITLADGSLHLEHAIFGTIQVPCHLVELWLLGAATEPALSQNILAELHARRETNEDRVWLVSGDSFAGHAEGFDGALRFRSGGQVIKFPATEVAGVAFARRSVAEPARAKYWFGLVDGTTVAAKDFSLLSDDIAASTASGIDLAGKGAAQLVYIQSLHPVTYLSDSEPPDYRHTPYFDISREMKIDLNLEQELSRVGDLHYRKCLAMHTAARAVFEVPPGTAHFAAEIAIDDSSGQMGSAIFRVYRVVEQRPELAYESPVVRGGDVPRSVNVGVSNASALILVVDFADFGDEQDHCLWLDPRWISAVNPG